MGREIDLDIAFIDVPAKVITHFRAVETEFIVEIVKTDIHFVSHSTIQIIDDATDSVSVRLKISTRDDVIADSITAFFGQYDIANRILNHLFFGYLFSNITLFLLANGFYNLFLAVEVLVGVIVTVTTTAGGIGLALTLAGTVSMSGAAAVLWLTSPDNRGAALKQGLLPVVAVVLLAVGAAM